MSIDTDLISSNDNAEIGDSANNGNQEKKADDTVAQPFNGLVPSSGFSVPSKRVSINLQGQPYLDFIVLAERIVFSDGTTLSKREKESEILLLAIKLLEKRVKEVSENTANVFVRTKDL